MRLACGNENCEIGTQVTWGRKTLKRGGTNWFKKGKGKCTRMPWIWEQEKHRLSAGRVFLMRTKMQGSLLISLLLLRLFAVLLLTLLTTWNKIEHWWIRAEFPLEAHQLHAPGNRATFYQYLLLRDLWNEENSGANFFKPNRICI